jgi:hypothetical protein
LLTSKFLKRLQINSTLPYCSCLYNIVRHFFTCKRRKMDILTTDHISTDKENICMKKMISCFLLFCTFQAVAPPVTYATATPNVKPEVIKGLTLIKTASNWADLFFYFAASNYYEQLNTHEQAKIEKKARCEAQLIGIPITHKKTRDLLYEIFNYKLNDYKPMLYAEAKKNNIPTKNKSLQYIGIEVIKAKLKEGCF